MSTLPRASGPGTGGLSERARTIGILVFGAVAWVGAYALNEYVWDAIVGWLGLDIHIRAVSAVHFFLYDTVKILLLLTGLMFVVGMLRASLDLDKARDYLQGRGLFVGLILAVVLGVVTPFCSCSSIPLFIGFVAAGMHGPSWTICDEYSPMTAGSAWPASPMETGCLNGPSADPGPGCGALRRSCWVGVAPST